MQSLAITAHHHRLAPYGDIGHGPEHQQSLLTMKKREPSVQPAGQKLPLAKTRRADQVPF
eukprot:7130349-Karenia_brevis.AAC.1